jgi:hypothetical protein
MDFVKDPRKLTLPSGSSERRLRIPYSRKRLIDSPATTSRPITDLPDIPAQHALKGITPAELMLNAMREFNEEAEEAFELANSLDPTTNAKRRAELQSYGRTMIQMAVDVAKDVAPYVHPRLNATTLSSDPDSPLAILSAEELKKFVRG